MPAIARSILLVAAVLLGDELAASDSLSYTLTPQPDNQRLIVELEWRTSHRTQSSLCVAERWGRVSNVARLLRNVVIDGATQVRRRGECWDLRHRAGARLRCQYEVAAGRDEFDWETIHYPIVTEKLFHGFGTAFLLAPVPGGGTPREHDVLLRWKLPREWDAACTWAPGAHVGARLTSDELRHAVYYAGDLDLHTTKVPGAAELTVALVDAFDFSPEEFAQTAKKIIAAECRAMEEAAFPPYVITVLPISTDDDAVRQRLAGNGLARGFSLFLSRGAKLTDGLEHLFAHELFHHWNGRLLPAEEPDELVYWFTEGFTDYYALRILHASGVWSSETYAKWLNRHLREYHQNPARNVSNETIATQYWAQRDTVGEVPYQRGLLLGLRWHHLARERGVAEGLDALFQDLLERGRAGSFKLDNATLRAAGVRVLGDWFGPEFDQFVRDAQTVNVPPDALEPVLTGSVQPTYEYELGFDRQRTLAQERVVGLERNSAAATAGLRRGDELLGWSIPAAPDEKVTLQVLRGEQVRTISYYPRGERTDVLQFRPTKEGILEGGIPVM